MYPRVAIPAAVLVLLAAACGGSGQPADDRAATGATASATPAGQLSVFPASFDLATGEDVRFTAGIATQQGLLVGGQVDMTFGYLGRQTPAQSPATSQPSTGEPVATATGTFLPVPGQGPTEITDRPVVSTAGARGVYETSVDLAEPGLYTVSVTVELDGRPHTGAGTFRVAQQRAVPAPGEPAPAVSNPTVDEPGDAPPGAIDSRARNNDGQVPDPALHDTTVAAVLEAGRPAVVLISTPVYCQSQFCGPITEEVERLQAEYGDRAAFIHLEVWRDFENGQLNPAAAEWIQTDQGGNEPWTFLVGADGTIRARWDNVLDAAELERMLRELPA